MKSSRTLGYTVDIMFPLNKRRQFAFVGSMATVSVVIALNLSKNFEAHLLAGHLRGWQFVN